MMADTQAVKQRAKAAILGCLAADAAVQPLHWIYDVNELNGHLKDNPAPEFYKKWSCPFYVIETGSNSCYGDQAYVLLKSLVENKGLSMSHYVKATVEMFGPGTPYAIPKPAKREDLPKKSPWPNGNILKSLDKLAAGDEKAGADEADSDAFAKITPLVALYAGKSELGQKVDQAVRITLNNDKSVQTAQVVAKLLEYYILHGKDDNAVATIMNSLPDSQAYLKDEIDAILKEKSTPHQNVIQKFGQGCLIPGSFQGALHTILTSTDFVSGVRTEIGGSGASCPRACAVGACLAAQQGPDCIPDEWKKKILRWDEYNKLADELVNFI